MLTLAFIGFGRRSGTRPRFGGIRAGLEGGVSKL
jgi:hypothetical protein